MWKDAAKSRGGAGTTYTAPLCLWPTAMARALAGLIMCLAVCTVHAGEKPAKAALRGSKGMVVSAARAPPLARRPAFAHPRAHATQKMQNPFTGRMVRVPRNGARLQAASWPGLVPPPL